MGSRIAALPSSWRGRIAAALVAAWAVQSIVAAPARAGQGAAPVEMHGGHQLTGLNFKESVADGIWLIEHYSPWCHHCKAFAPTWIQLVEARQDQEESINFHLGQVDCSVDGDLCDANNVKGYPSVFLYENGEYVEQYKKERTPERLNQWLDDRLPDDPTHSAVVAAATAITAPEGAIHAKVAQAEGAALLGAGAALAAGVESGKSVFASAVAGDATTEGTALAADRAKNEQASPTATGLPNEPVFQIQQNHVVQKRLTPNTEGKVQSVGTPELERLLSPDSENGPVFVKFFAPWCGHCKHLAPTWSDLASVLKNKVNVVEFDCDTPETKAKCKEQGIMGYPTLVFYNGGEKAEYKGSRSLSQMEAFANKAALATGMRDMSPSELTSIATEEEVFFLYLYPASTPETEVELVHKAARTLVGSASVYKSSSQDLFAHFKFPPNNPYLIVFKDHETHPASSLNFTRPRSTATLPDSGTVIVPNPEDERSRAQAEIAQWLHGNKHPTLAELGSSNYNSYMGPFENALQASSASYVVLAALSKKALGASAFDERKERLAQIARAWRQGAALRPRGTPVNFVWVDQDTWAKHLASTYGVKAFDKEPAVIIADPVQDRFYPVDAQGLPLRIDGRQLFAALESIYDGTLKPKISLSYGERVGRYLGVKLHFLVVAFTNHPILSSLVAIVLFIALFSVLVYILDSDDASAAYVQLQQAPRNGSPPTHQPKYVETKNSLYGGSAGSNSVKKD